jgi:hypothetical protein
MTREVESDRLRHDLKHYRAELITTTDPRDAKVLREHVSAIEARLRILELKQRSQLWALSESDVWRAAQRLICQHGLSAPEIAAEHADALSKENSRDGAVLWRRILRAAEELLRTTPRPDERVN